MYGMYKSLWGAAKVSVKLLQHVATTMIASNDEAWVKHSYNYREDGCAQKYGLSLL